MRFEKVITDRDLALVASKLQGFLPGEVYDIHAHPYNPAHFSPDAFPFLKDAGAMGCAQHRNALLRYMPVKLIHGLYFGMPHRSAARAPMNAWVSAETAINGTAISRSLKVVAPEDDPIQLLDELRKGLYCGLKVYHIYASAGDTTNASICAYAPEWMWELLHETKGILMLHIVKDGAIEDEDNQHEIRRLSVRYPGVRIILAHIARSFNYRHARKGLQTLSDLDNVYVDTAAICETESFRVALKTLGPRRILWGSDFAISEVRGRCVTTGDHFFWLHPEVVAPGYASPTSTKMTLVGLESLLALQEACEDSGMTRADIQDIFRDNALRLLKISSV